MMNLFINFCWLLRLHFDNMLSTCCQTASRRGKVPNKKAIQNEEQLLLLEELRDLRDCYIETSH